MWAEQPAHDEMDARRNRVDLRACREPVLSGPSPTAQGPDQPPVSGGIDFPPPQRTASTPACELSLDRDERIPFAGETRDRAVRGRVVLSIGAAFVGLAAIGMAAGYFLPGAQTPAPSSSSSPAPGPERPAGVADASKADRVAVDQPTTRGIDRFAPANLPHSPLAVAPVTIVRAKPSPAASAAHARLAAAPPPAPAMIDRPARPTTEAPRVPVPETRPTTLDGWTLREIVDGTAVVDGPGGSWRVRRGDTLPGAGKVIGILHWGNRMIVATSRGLISTP